MSSKKLFILVMSLISSVASAQMTRINAGNTVDISRFCICRHVVNGGTKDFMVPYNSLNEFTSFIQYPPSGTTLSLCSTGNYGPPAFTLTGGSATDKFLTNIATMSNMSSTGSCSLTLNAGTGVGFGCTLNALKNSDPAIGIMTGNHTISFSQGDTLQLAVCCSSDGSMPILFSKTVKIKNDYGDVLSSVSLGVNDPSGFGNPSCP